MRLTSIAVKHNIEVAHRLFELPGKCERIHGHSMWVTLAIEGPVNDKGLLSGIEYGALKKLFRGYLDAGYDHSLLLNEADPFAGELISIKRDAEGQVTPESEGGLHLPGLVTCPADPTTENIAAWIIKDMRLLLQSNDMQPGLLKCTVWETSVNQAEVIDDGEDD
jgi:6-pyruvoyl-tetrahydropterin synthase